VFWRARAPLRAAELNEPEAPHAGFGASPKLTWHAPEARGPSAKRKVRDDEGVIASSPRDESVRLADTRAVWAP